MGRRRGGGSASPAMRTAGCVFLLLAARAAARPDRDFEFDDDALQELRAGEASLPRHRFVYDPHSPLCRGVSCGAGERCVLRDARTALCVTHDTVNAADDELNDDSNDVDAADRCVRCDASGAAAGGGAVCGADGRTYPSLCALDYANCRRRARVAPRCARACPCPEASSAPHRRGHHEEGAGAGAGGTARCSATALAERLLAWFTVLQAGAPPPPRAGFPRDCKAEVRWMFAHLDTDGDGRLSADNLYALEHDERERCLRPFLRRCGAGGAGGVTPRGWCGCMRRAARPCAAVLRAHRGAGAAGWRPACDARGWFLPRQCRAARCWCVDARGAARPRDACGLLPGTAPADQEWSEGGRDGRDEVDDEDAEGIDGADDDEGSGRAP